MSSRIVQRFIVCSGRTHEVCQILRINGRAAFVSWHFYYQPGTVSACSSSCSSFRKKGLVYIISCQGLGEGVREGVPNYMASLQWILNVASQGGLQSYKCIKQKRMKPIVIFCSSKTLQEEKTTLNWTEWGRMMLLTSPFSFQRGFYRKTYRWYRTFA